MTRPKPGVADDVRVVLFTGKGGVGKTTASAGTAAAIAARGQRTLILSTDAAHSLGDAFGQPIGFEPTAVAPNLWVQHVDAQRRLEESWTDVQGYMLAVLDAAGVDRITAEELTVIPVAEEILALLEVRAQVRSGLFDVVIVDCAPTAETLRLLALPEALGWYMERVFPLRGTLLKAISPILKKATGVPMPQDHVFDAMERLHSELHDVHTLLTGPRASVRLVLTPETVVVAEARRALTTLSLFGFVVDGVVANRVFPAEGADEWRQTWVKAQQQVLEDVEASFGALPIWRSPYLPYEPVGVSALVEFGEQVYAGQHPAPAVVEQTVEQPISIEANDSATVLRIALPFAERSEVDLARHGDELVVTVGHYRRLIALPQSLRTSKITGAAMREGALRIRFEREAERG